MKHINKTPILAAGMLLLVNMSYAAEDKDLAQLPKDIWLEQVKQAVPEPICKSFLDDASIAAQMSANHISYDQCLKQIPTLASKCEQKYYNSLPASITQENAEKWGQLLGECIGNDYAMHYLSVDQNASQAISPES